MTRVSFPSTDALIHVQVYTDNGQIHTHTPTQVYTDIWLIHAAHR